MTRAIFSMIDMSSKRAATVYTYSGVSSQRSAYLFYIHSSEGEVRAELPAPYSYSVWRPLPWRPWLPGKSKLKIKLRFLFRSALHHLRLFRGRECGALCVFYGGSLVHYSGYTPRYWRFPFLQDSDLQIGDTWTEPSHRGKGLALFALLEIIRIKRKPERRFWYVVGALNAPSIRVVEKSAFSLVGKGTFVVPLGIKLLGSYVMTRRSLEQDKLLNDHA
jgi:RimJ/RimL family protein N-acetyltransferase